MVNFCNPGFMDLKKFRDVFATPIVLGRDPNATPQQKLESQSRSSAVRIFLSSSSLVARAPLSNHSPRSDPATPRS